MWPSVEELMERYKTACNLKQVVDREAIVAAFASFNAHISQQILPIRFARDDQDARTVAKAARAAWAARDARDARAARAARAAWAAWAARAAWAASWEISWLAPIVIGARQTEDKSTFDKWFPIFLALEAGAFACWWTDKELVIAERPALVAVDEQRRLHSDIGPAFDFLGVQDFYWRGVHVPKVVVVAPEQITLAMIDTESNLEVKRIMIERYGFGRYLLDKGGKRVNHDGHGILWSLDQGRNSPPIMLAEVFNPTPEPDGVMTKTEVLERFCRDVRGNEIALHRSMAYVVNHSDEAKYKRYFLPVHPELRPMRRNKEAPGGVELLGSQDMTCHAAVASTYGKYAHEYDPDMRT